MACANGHQIIVDLLLKHGADPNLLNESKNTPLRTYFLQPYFLDWAALNGRIEVVERLLEAKADPNIKNEFDKIPLEEALQNGFTHVAEVLAKVSILSDDKVYTSI